VRPHKPQTPSMRKSRTAFFLLLFFIFVIDDVLILLVLRETALKRLRILGWVAILAAVGTLSFLLALAVYRTHRARPRTGNEGLVGTVGVCVTPVSPRGTVDLRGEIWQAVSRRNLEPGERVVVEAVRGLTLEVRALD